MARTAGVVVSFDADAGLGLVRAEGNVAELGFHCTSIADGSRSIAVGSSVTYEMVAGGGGRWEATDIVTVDAG